MASIAHQPIDTDVSANMHKKDFKDKIVWRLSVTQLIFGTLSVACGLVVEVLSLIYYCPYRVKIERTTTSTISTPTPYWQNNDDRYDSNNNNYGYDQFQYYYCSENLGTSKLGSGIWCGVFFIVAGIIGLYAAKRKTTCMLVTLLAVSVTATGFAVFQCALGIMSAVTLSRLPDVVGTVAYKIPLICINGVLGLLGLTEFALLVASSAFSCKATCCETSPIYLTSDLYQPVVHSAVADVLQPASQPFLAPTPGGQLVYAQQNFGSGMTAPQPYVLIPYNAQNAMSFPQLSNCAQPVVALAQPPNVQTFATSAAPSNENGTPKSVESKTPESIA